MGIFENKIFVVLRQSIAFSFNGLNDSLMLSKCLYSD